MQLNTLTLNPYTPPPQSKSKLAIYDHKLAVVNTEIFVFGKNIQNFSIQTPLQKINLQTLTVQPVYTLNPPIFQDFIMFSFQQNIYFWGKTPNSQKNQFFQFDGCKFTNMDQNGPIPQPGGHYSHTKFSYKFVLLFSCLPQDEFKIKWYLFDIKKRQWKTIISEIQIPACQKSQMIWLNGRGYLLLSSVYDKTRKEFRKNTLYELKFKSFNNLILQIQEIHLSKNLQSFKVVFTDLVAFNEQELFLIGGQEILSGRKYQENQNKNFALCTEQNSQSAQGLQEQNQKIAEKIVQMQKNSEQRMEQEINLNENKIVYKLDLEILQWSKNNQTIPIKGQYHQIATFGHKVYFVGGIYNQSLLNRIQCYDFRSKEENRQVLYEQSVCYYCQSAFTYNQSLINQPIVENEYEKFCPKNQIENKLVKKLSQSIITELHAIAIVCDFLVNSASQQIHIELCEYINPEKNIKMAKANIEKYPSQILSFRSFSTKSISQKALKRLFTNTSQLQQQQSGFEGLEISFMQLKMASFKIGQGFLYVSFTDQGSIFVGYGSYSQIQFPESNYRSFSETCYTIKYNKINKTVDYSSQMQRHIVYENVKLHFGSPQEYQNVKIFDSLKTLNFAKNFTNIYVVGVTNIEKKISLSGNYFEDIQVKSLPKKSCFNSLRNYISHAYLNQDLDFKLLLQNREINILNVYQIFQELKRTKKIYEISSTQESILKKSQNQQTHFSTNHEDIVIGWKKIDIVQKCKFFQVNSNQKLSIPQTYKSIFIYKNKKLLKTFSTKKKLLCGVIELLSNIQIQLDCGQLVNRNEERNLIKWIEQLQKSIANEVEPFKEDL